MQLLRPGDAVRVRRQRWRVVETRSYAACQVVALEGVGPGNLGVELRLISPFDILEPLTRSSRLRVVRPRCWRQACRALLADDGPADRLGTAQRARIELLPFQLEPAIALLRGLASRILIADEVGLGKTIQAGLAVSELRARGAADRVLILTPAGLREQWRDELRDRFSLDSSVVDMREARRRAAAAAVGVNPWKTLPTVVASLDYVKRPEVLRAVADGRWDVVVIDEAHGLTPQSDRYRAASVLCQAAAYVLLLTATPHSGDREAFESLRQIGACAGDGLLVFRRSRADAGMGNRRRVHRLLVGPSAAERLMYQRLEQFSQALFTERGEGDSAVWLALGTLHKRALSCAWSLGQSIARRLAHLIEPQAETTGQAGLPFGDGEGELDVADAAPEWTSPGLSDTSRERQMLDGIARAAETAVGHETKLHALVRLLNRLRRRGEQAIVFTEYRDTLVHVRNRLTHPCAILHGGLTRDDRRAALDDFSTGRRSVLLATDAAGEGLNLHHACRVVINLELPWNPVRLEQRAGRVDRIGQTRAVHVFHLIARESREMRVLEHLRSRVERARREIDASDPLDFAPEDSSDGSLAPGSAASSPELTAAAALEHARLTCARALRTRFDHETREAGHLPIVAFADRSGTRAWLGTRVLVVLRATVEDGCGRLVAARLTPCVLRAGARMRGVGRAELLQFWRDLDRLAPAIAGPGDAAFEAHAFRLHRAFREARLCREQAVAARLQAGPTAGLVQPGLFDRRAVRDRMASAEKSRGEIDESNRRIADASRALTADVTPSRVVLILVP
jgi:superfamily II DNA or RNA helicase